MSKKSEYDIYEPYKVINPNFAFGGNAKILLVEDKNGKQFALKRLEINGPRDIKRVKRFLNEIAVVEKYQDYIKGIIPIRYKDVPKGLSIILDPKSSEKSKGTVVWYVMDLAIAIKEKLDECNDLEVLIDCFIFLSGTLVMLHGCGIVHRDIKPSNLYFYEGHWSFGDFGLVAYPELEFDSLTKTGDRIGNYATIAPEMRHTKHVEDARPADVWSFAKTMWMILTKNWDDCFEGSYDTNDEAISIKKYWSDVPINHLEDILKKATSYQPRNRIDINELLRLLVEYKEILNDRKAIWKSDDLRRAQQEAQLEGKQLIYYSTDISINANDVMFDLKVNWESEESKFIEKGLRDQVRVLKYLTMKLEHYSSNVNRFVVSPIIEHFRNPKMPAIKVFVRYTNNEVKFVAFILCDGNSVVEFTHSNEVKNFYGEDGNIDFCKLDEMVEVINKISMKSVRNSRN